MLSPFLVLINNKFHRKVFHPFKTDSGKCSFELANSVKDLRLIEDGYWYKDKVDIDLYRGEDYLNKRFFDNSVHTYYVYCESKTTIPCYFVVRPVLYRGIGALLLVDYRYDSNCPEILTHMIKAVKKLALRNHIGLILTTTGDEGVVRMFKGPFAIIKRAEVVTNKKVTTDAKCRIPITPADSDNDFLS